MREKTDPYFYFVTIAEIKDSISIIERDFFRKSLLFFCSFSLDIFLSEAFWEKKGLLFFLVSI